MRYDSCETLGHSEIQHGPHSNRVYLMKLERRDLPGIIERIDDLASRHGYSKLFAKVPSDTAQHFTNHGYRKEAAIPGFYQGSKEAVFLGKYLEPTRGRVEKPEELENVLSLAKAKANRTQSKNSWPSGQELIVCSPDHADEMSRIYREVFPTYPFPIHDPVYLRDTMASHIAYFGIVKEGELIALSSAEMDVQSANAEMTDFATLPGNRGQGLARALLRAMENAMSERKMYTAYTIARAVSPGMNITFAQMGYRFGGLLVNNTQISGSIESMNVWHKAL